MNNQNALQELGLSQMRVINRFFDIRIEVLFALLRHRDIMYVAPVQRAFSEIDRGLMRLWMQIEPVTGETHAEHTLRLRGCNALRRMLVKAIHRTQEAVRELMETLNREGYTAEEWHTIQDAADSLAVILDSNLYLLDQSNLREE